MGAAVRSRRGIGCASTLDPARAATAWLQDGAKILRAGARLVEIVVKGQDEHDAAPARIERMPVEDKNLFHPPAALHLENQCAVAKPQPPSASLRPHAPQAPAPGRRACDGPQQRPAAWVRVCLTAGQACAELGAACRTAAGWPIPQSDGVIVAIARPRGMATSTPTAAGAKQAGSG